MTDIFEYSGKSLYIRDMKPWGRFTFILIAYSLAFLHTVVPHQHDEATDNRVIITHGGCIFTHSMGGFLQLVFSTDLGYGHLETFNKNSDTKVDFSLFGMWLVAVLSPLISVPVSVGAYLEFTGGFIEKLQIRLLLFSTSHFRAPPLFS